MIPSGRLYKCLKVPTVQDLFPLLQSWTVPELIELLLDIEHLCSLRAVPLQDKVPMSELLLRCLEITCVVTFYLGQGAQTEQERFSPTNRN